MSKASFEEQLVERAYALGRSRDALMAENWQVSRRLRILKISARLQRISQRLDFAVVYFAATGGLPLVLLGGRTKHGDWPILLISLVLMIIGTGTALEGRRFRARYKNFCEKFQVSSCPDCVGASTRS